MNIQYDLCYTHFPFTISRYFYSVECIYDQKFHISHYPKAYKKYCVLCDFKGFHLYLVFVENFVKKLKL